MVKRYCVFYLFILSTFSLKAQVTNNVPFTEDTVSLIRNPGMGWMLYDDAYDQPANADNYWKVLDDAARKYASVLYLRWRWSDLEPEQGKYAWIYNDNFKKIIKGAKDRGLKLAFRIFYDSRDMTYNCTPLYVKKAGAEGFTETNGLWTPYPDDPVFQKKFDVFISAFAKAFDDPYTVDFIDGHGLGLWGEGWNVITSKTPKNIKHPGLLKDAPDYFTVFDWMLSAYAKHFKKVLLVFNFNYYNIPRQYTIAVQKLGFGLRRDGLGGETYGDQKWLASSLFPSTFFVAEAHYWMVNKPWNADNKPWLNDEVYGTKGSNQFKSWRDVYLQTYKDAIQSHANYLDLREEGEVMGLSQQAPDLIQKFILSGGYRIFPAYVKYPQKISSNRSFIIEHAWKNSGVGIMPNNNVRWSYKYKVAFALLDENTGEAVSVIKDKIAEPSMWMKDILFTYKSDDMFKNKPGNYILAVALINTNNNKPEINLAIENNELMNGWTVVGKIEIEK